MDYARVYNDSLMLCMFAGVCQTLWQAPAPTMYTSKNECRSVYLTTYHQPT
jgi:hypothetical protein